VSGSPVGDSRRRPRALIVPIVADGRVQAILTRRDFFRAVADRFTGLA